MQINKFPSYIKLTLWYMLIVMAISLVFSVAIYKVSFNELDRGFRRQPVVMQIFPNGDGLGMQSDNLEQKRIDRMSEIDQSIKSYLFYLNLIVLLLAAFASYFLAKKTLQPIEEMAEVQSRFTGDASHELRTPLTAMETEIEVALRDKKMTLAEAKELLRSNLEEIEKLKSLSNSLLRLAQYQNNEKQSVSGVCDLREIIEESKIKLDKIAEQRNIKIISDIDKAAVTGDCQSLTELFTILLDNAIKYSHDKSKIEITSEIQNKSVTISVKDHGLGIKASDVPYIFNRFYRADLSRSKHDIPGYGLGLSIAKKIIDAHNGKIDVISQPGKGSEFRVKLFLNHI
ncbi:MAG: HAMP domain-containing sensor histidine kinase [Candidatus Berkelbacteria bacterium]